MSARSRDGHHDPVGVPTGDNLAHDSQVGIQAQAIHGDVYYQVGPETPAHQRYEIGVRYLEARMASEARTLIEEAVARGHDNDEVRFHRLLALLSGRTLRQLSPEEFTHLEAVCAGIPRLDGGDRWRAGLRAILGLLGSLHTSGNADLVGKELEALDPPQRRRILDHLGVLIEGPQEDQIWRQAVDQAKADRWANDRERRIGLFFHPVPAEARTRRPVPVTVALGDRLRLVAGTAGFAAATGYLGWLLFRDPAVLPVLAWLLGLAGVTTAVHAGADRYFRRERRRARDAVLAAPPPRPRRRSSPGGFTRAVDRAFDHYFARYLPQHTDRAEWLTRTAGIRRHLRDEVVEIYREDRIDAERIRWLVRHLVSEVRQGWDRNTLTAYQRELRTPPRTMARYLGGLAALALGAWFAVPAALAADPLPGTLSLLLAVVCAPLGTRAWYRVTAEHRRYRADEAERARNQQSREQAHDAWRRKLAAKPTDAEMAAWLECDRRILVDETMRQYRLKPSQVIAHAFIEAPGRSYKRARVPRGPWRYSRYRLLLFLLTDDGVRQVNIDLDVERGTSAGTQRLNYRFDAVAAVRIDGVATGQQTFELTLVNGNPIAVRVTEAGHEGIQPGEDPGTLSRISLDASGLPHTLNLLEGIAAEGKEWIRQRRRRADERLADLTTIVNRLTTPEPGPDVRAQAPAPAQGRSRPPRRRPRDRRGEDRRS